MNEEQYLEVCEVCDRILLAPDSTIERVAIPWLHVIREHPVFLATYIDLFESADGRTIVRKLSRFLRYRAGWYRQIERSLRSDSRPWSGPKALPHDIDILFVSHLLNPSQAGQNEDFYFGGLPDALVAGGRSAIVALINHTGKDATPLAAMWNGSPVPRVILSGSLRFLEEVALHRRLKKESVRLKKLAKKEAPSLAHRIFERASEEALSGGALLALRMVSQIGALVMRLQPQTIMITHEGHAWERMVFAAARSVRPNVQCFGYQHAALFRLQHAIRRNLAREYNPDKILTAGMVGKAQLERAPGLNGIPVSVLGSNRIFKGVAIKSNRTLDSDQSYKSHKYACLVLPEGIASECHLLFGFSLTCAQSCPDIQFIWRLHPVVAYESLAAKNPKLRNLPENVVLSQETMEEDMALCRWALYRGTTAVVPGVVAGLRPIYLQLSNEMTIDPLYELPGWRISVKTIAEFHRAIKFDQDGMPSDSEREFRFAEEYCKDFFTSLNPGVLQSLLMSKDKVS